MPKYETTEQMLSAMIDRINAAFNVSPEQSQRLSELANRLLGSGEPPYVCFMMRRDPLSDLLHALSEEDRTFTRDLISTGLLAACLVEESQNRSFARKTQETIRRLQQEFGDKNP